MRTILLFIGLIPFSFASAQIKTHCQGQGPSLFLIGGGPAFTTWHLEPVQEQLASDYRVCRWDMRGVGENARAPLAGDEPALEQWLQDMATVLPEEPVLLWGHSWGALQSLLFAARYPQRVRALVLSNPVDPGLQSLDGIEQRRVEHPDPRGGLALDDYGTAAETRHNFHAKIASYFVAAEQGWDYARQFDPADFNSALNVRVWARYRAAPLQASALQSIAAKISGIIYCDQDVLMPENRQAYRQMVPHTRHEVIDGCSHFPWVEQPRAYFDVLQRLLRAAGKD